MTDREGEARRAVAEALERDAEVLTDEWLDVLASRLEIRPSRLLPDDTLRDHVPAAIRWVAQRVATPSAPAGNEAAEVMTALSRLRRDQGEGIEELLEELEALVEIVGRRCIEVLRSIERLAPAAAGRIVFDATYATHRMARPAASVHASSRANPRRDGARRTTDYVRMIGHEMKSPLALVRSLAAELADPEAQLDPEDRARMARSILERSDRIGAILDDLAVLARMEDGLTEERQTPLRRVVEYVFDELSDAAALAGVRLEVVEPLEEVDVGAYRVELALANLVANGIRFHDPEKDQRWVRVSAGPAEGPELTDALRITVEDNGLGIPRGVHPRVFQRFFRARPEVAEGTGLGLWIVRTVAERSGGRVWFDSEEGRGSRFHFVIPDRPSGQGAGRSPETADTTAAEVEGS